MVPPKSKKFELWLYENEKSANSIDSYMYSVKLFFQKYNKLTKANMIDFKRRMITDEYGYSFKTANVKLAGINSYCDFVNMPECKVKQYKSQKKLAVDNVISLRQYNKLLQCLKDDNNMKWYFIIKVLGMTGVRVSELIQIKIDDFEQQYSIIYNKGKSRKVYLPKSLCEEVIEFYKDKPDTIYLCESSQKDKQAMTTRGIASCLRRFGQLYNIDIKVMHAHSFRHFFAINFLKSNKDNDIVLLSNLLGHSNINTTAIYLQKTENDQIRELNKTINW